MEVYYGDVSAHRAFLGLYFFVQEKKFNFSTASQTFVLKTRCTTSPPPCLPDYIYIALFLKQCPNMLKFFYSIACLQHFDVVNKRLQSNSSRVHVVKRDLNQLLRKLLNCYMKPSAMHAREMEVDFKSNYNIKEDARLTIGKRAEDHLQKGLDAKEKDAFFKNVRVFYQTGCQYIVDNLNTQRDSSDPEKTKLWNHAEVRNANC
jgi:hypothetical protein